MSNPDDKSKANGLGTDPLQRLASFKAPRDLSLGGPKPSKKVFTPNLNVARNKNKGPSSSNAWDQKKDDKGRRDRKNDRNKNNRNGPNVIKSGGVFSEGLGSTEKHSSRATFRRDASAPRAAAELQRPTISPKDLVKIDKEQEEQRIKAVVGESGASDEEACEDFKLARAADAPVRLPMLDVVWTDKENEAQTKVKLEIKTELPGDGADEAVLLEAKPELKAEVFENAELVNVLRGDQPALMLLQLPDALPGRGGGAEHDAPRRRRVDGEPSDAASAENTDDTPESEPHCRLASLAEGRIGRLRVHRSGRVTLALGDTVFEVSSGTRCSFHQEAVSVAADEASRSARLVALGAVQHKLSVLPHWEAMFNDMPL